MTLIWEEFETAFKSFIRNNAAGADTINSNIFLHAYDEIKYTLFLIFKTSLQQGDFPSMLKIAKVTPIIESGDAENLTSYRHILVLPVFFKNSCKNHVQLNLQTPKKQ